MSEPGVVPETLRTLFCIGVNQNFMDATQEEMGEVWSAFSGMMKAIRDMEGVTVLGVLDDDRTQVGPSVDAPWTAYIMADMPNYGSVVEACNLFRTMPVGDGTYKLWKYCKVDARIGRGLEIPA